MRTPPQEHDPSSAEGRTWLAAMPVELGKQRVLLERLLDACETTPGVTSLSVGCSLGRGAGDPLSDVDAAVGVDAARGEPGAADLLAVEEAVVAACLTDQAPVGVLRDRVGSQDSFVRRTFVQFANGVQLDLAVVAEPEVRRGDAAPDFVSLYRSTSTRTHDGTDEPQFPPAHVATLEQVHEWTFLGWVALIDLAKYLQRGSLWEAHQRLTEARDRAWALWAVAEHASYPWHGLSQVLDQDPVVLPADIERTVARLDRADLLQAARSMAGVLRGVSELAAGLVQAPLPTDLADYATSRLEKFVE